MRHELSSLYLPFWAQDIQSETKLCRIILLGVMGDGQGIKKMVGSTWTGAWCCPSCKLRFVELTKGRWITPDFRVFLPRNHPFRTDPRSFNLTDRRYRSSRVHDTIFTHHVPVTVPKGVSSKLFTHWKGPYQIMEQTGPLNYKIRGCNIFFMNHAIVFIYSSSPFLELLSTIVCLFITFPLYYVAPPCTVVRSYLSSMSGNDMSEAAAVSQLTCLSMPQSKPPPFPFLVCAYQHSLPFSLCRKSVLLQCPPTLSTIMIPPFSQSIPFSQAPDRPDGT
eukprot:g78760.t1